MDDNLTICLNTDNIVFDSSKRMIEFTVYDSCFGYKKHFNITFDNLVMLKQEQLYNMNDKFFNAI